LINPHEMSAEKSTIHTLTPESSDTEDCSISTINLFPVRFVAEAVERHSEKKVKRAKKVLPEEFVELDRDIIIGSGALPILSAQ